MAETATKTGGSKTKALAASSTSDVIWIKWFKSHNNKVTAGDQRFRAYKDRNGTMRILIDPRTNEPKSFTVFAYKDYKLDTSVNEKGEPRNPWHKAVYEFLIGDTKPGGPWLGHDRLNPKRKLLYMVNATEEAKKNTLNRQQLRKMEVTIEEMEPDRLLLFGYLFGASGKDMGYDDVLNALIELVHTPAHTEGMLYTSKDVQDKLLSSDLDYHLVVAGMLMKGMLKFDNGVYKYENAGIGMDLDAVVVWLKDQPNIFASLKPKFLKDANVAANS